MSCFDICIGINDFNISISKEEKELKFKDLIAKVKNWVSNTISTYSFDVIDYNVSYYIGSSEIDDDFSFGYYGTVNQNVPSMIYIRIKAKNKQIITSLYEKLTLTVESIIDDIYYKNGEPLIYMSVA